MCTREKTKQQQKRSIYRIHYDLAKNDSDPGEIRPHYLRYKSMNGIALYKYGAQVAGHRNGDDKYLGLLQCNGTVLKPILKKSQSRERMFYERIWKTEDKYLRELRNYTPTYFGCKTFTYNGVENEYIVLKEITAGMFEPCIMDIKIGRRTWDPLASEEKARSEQSKYSDCKRDVAFCIPGFQVYNMSGDLRKYGKDYGKRLNGETVREALRLFLNATNNKPCRCLILQFLTELWFIQKWASKQTALKLYSSSLLLCYDAKRLRECCGNTDDEFSPKSKCKITPSLRSTLSSNSIKSMCAVGPNFSGQISQKGPIYKKIMSVPCLPIQLANTCFSQPAAIKRTAWHDALQTLQRSHSFHNNYEDNLSRIKLNYHSMLDELTSDSSRSKPWVVVKMIDFVHAFFTEENEEPTIDTNFLEGIQHLVTIFEEFLHETEE